MLNWKRGVLSSIILGVMLLLFAGCGAAPPPTIDQASLEATITAKVIATQTANAPSVTPTPSLTPTASPSPTVTQTPSPTPLPPIPAANIPNGWRIYSGSALPFTFAYPPEWGVPFYNGSRLQYQWALHMVTVGRSELFQQWPSGSLEEAGAFIIQRYLSGAQPDVKLSIQSQGSYQDDVHISYFVELHHITTVFDGGDETVWIRLRDNSVFALAFDQDQGLLSAPQRDTIQQVVSTIRENASVPYVSAPQPDGTPRVALVITPTASAAASLPTPTNTLAPTLSAPASPAASSATPNLVGKWTVVLDKSGFSDTQTVVLRLDAEKAVTGWLDTHTPTLILRCQEKTTEVYIVVGMQQVVESGALDTSTVRLRWDDLPASTATTDHSTDNKALFFRNPRQMIQQLLGHKTLIFGFTPFNASPVETSFVLDGLSEAVKPLQQACPN